jgi:uncharacterized surface protein with fasciclin (FAS1) repeats
MISNRLFAAAAAFALLTAGAASAQTPAAPPPAADPNAAAAPMAPPAPKAWSPPPATGQSGAAYVRIAPSGDMIATLQAAGQFNTLIKVLEATGLTNVIRQQNNLTLFAPTDGGFDALPQGKLNELLQGSHISELQQIMTYHLVNTRVDSSKLAGSRGPVPTAANQPIYIDGTFNPIKVNNAYVVQADIVTSNGVIHVINQPLSSQFTPPPPPAEETTPPPAETPPAPPATPH